MPRKKFWFGTQHHAQWIDTPLRGADMSPEGWGTSGTLLSGGGYAFNSPDAHKNYIFEWSGASSRNAAETLQAYRDGVYSMSPRDLIYFQDPLNYDRNVLPKRWAHPGILATREEEILTPLGDVKPVSSPSGFVSDGVPLKGAEITGGDLSEFNTSELPGRYRIWVPVPQGMTLTIKSWVTGDSSGNGLYVRPLNASGNWGSSLRVENSGQVISGVQGVLLGIVGKFNFFGARATLKGTNDHWVPGSGNSGCEFVGSPTWIANTGVNGGQIGYAATLKEVGDWQ